jgi:ribosome-binding protein aMBF1 (putative translation factor)
MATKHELTPAELRTWMDKQGWSIRGLAEELNRAPSTVQRWRDAELPIPDYLPLMLERLGQGNKGRPDVREAHQDREKRARMRYSAR